MNHPSRREPLDNLPPSTRSVHSNSSSKSQREIILERSRREVIENRLSSNISSLNRVNQSMTRSRASSRSSAVSMRQSMKIPRSKSTIQLNPDKSRARILEEIATKLQEQRVKWKDVSVSGSRKTIKERQINQKQIAEPVRAHEPQEDKTLNVVKNRFNKLNSMLSDIKKCHKQTNKVVYVIKKSKKEEVDVVPLQKVDLKDIYGELREVRQELREAKRKNEQLIAISRVKDQFNQSQHSHQSRISNQPIYFDPEIDAFSSNSQSNHGETGYYRYNTTSNNGYQNSDKWGLTVACPACGCTCRGKAH